MTDTPEGLVPSGRKHEGRPTYFGTLAQCPRGWLLRTDYRDEFRPGLGRNPRATADIYVETVAPAPSPEPPGPGAWEPDRLAELEARVADLEHDQHLIEDRLDNLPRPAVEASPTPPADERQCERCWAAVTYPDGSTYCSTCGYYEPAPGSAPVRQDPDLVAVMLTRDQAWELRREDQRHWLVVACYEALRSEQGED